MTKTLNLARIAVILLFAITFMLIGLTAPSLYATYVPADHVIEVHNYEAQDTTTNSDVHYVCFDRTVASGTSADVITELYLVDDTGRRIEVETSTEERYFQQGRQTVIAPRKLPDTLHPGAYRYVVVTEIEMANNRVTRQFVFESQTFSIEDGPPLDPDPPKAC